MSKKSKYTFFGLIIIVLFVFVILFKNTNVLKKSSLEGMNIILLTLDTTRADYISAYGKGKAKTPNLDKIAEEGVLFENCMTQSPLTLPAHISILSATYPLYNNVRDNVGFPISKKLEFVSETLKINGFKTSAFISSFVLHSKWGMDQGFDTYSDDFSFDKFSIIKVQQRGDITLNKAKKWLTKNKKNKFFSWIHLYDPHTPYAAPAPYDKKYPNDPYRGEIEYMDDLLGQFFKFLKKKELYDNSIIVIVGDHGEALGQHGEADHGFFIYNETIHVPLMIRAPETFSKKKIKDFVELVDLAPTILEMQGIEIPRTYQGESLLGLMNGDKKRKNDIAYAESYFPRLHFGWSELKGFYFAKHFKYIIAPKEELYDLSKDPGEERNIIDTNPRILKKYKGKFMKFVKLRSKNALKLDFNTNVSTGDMDKLKSLGYLGNSVDTSEKKNLADPKDKVHILRKLSEALSLMEKSQKYDEAIILLEKILEEDKNIASFDFPADVMFYLGNAYLKKKMYDKAIKYYRETLLKKPNSFSSMFNIINTLVDMKKYDEALVEAKNYIEKFPDDFTLYNKLGSVYFLLKKPLKALNTYKKAVSLEKSNSVALAEIGRIYISMGKNSEALSYLKKAENYNPKQFGLNFLFGLLEDRKGDKAAAVKFYKKEIEINPKGSKALFNLAIETERGGNLEEAAEYFKRVIELRPGFNFPYFMTAKCIFEKTENLIEARDLCEKGVKLKPFDRYTVYGHLLLSDIYHRLGDDVLSQKNYDAGMKLREDIKAAGNRE